ncbi:MAG: AmmeMemoRadiSam system protein A [Verrucomicrobiota bacterium]
MKTEYQNLLLQIARDAISQGLNGEKAPSLEDVPAELMEERATFVTLEIGGHLRGCIGMLEACRPLAEDVAHNARAAAFKDPRFPAVSRKEVDLLEIHISVLSPPEEIAFSSEADLLAQIRTGIDGLILQEGYQRGTFLPSVWEELPEKEMFLSHLKMKAGLPDTYWSDTLRVFRYTTEYFG